MSTQPKTDSGAVASMVLGVLGLTVFPVILSVPAFFAGRKAKKRIKASGGTLGGYELAQDGWWLGLCGMVMGALGVLFFAMIVVEGIMSGGEL